MSFSAARKEQCEIVINVEKKSPMLKTIATMLKIGGVGLIISCLFPFGFGIFLYSRSKTFLDKSVKTVAVVSDLRERRGVFYPVFFLRDKNGEEHSFRSNSGRYPSAYQRGDSVPILYNPENLEEARTNSFIKLWFFPVLCGGMDVGSIVVGGACLFASRRISEHLKAT